VYTADEDLNDIGEVALARIGEVLQEEICARAEGRAQRAKDEEEQGRHRRIMHEASRHGQAHSPSSSPSGNKTSG